MFSRRVIPIFKRNLSKKKINPFDTQINLYEYFKLPIDKRIQLNKEKKDFNLDLYDYFKLPIDQRKDYKVF